MMTSLSQVVDKALELGLTEIWLKPVRQIKRGLVAEDSMSLYRIVSKDVIVGHFLMVPNGEPLVIFNANLEV